MVAIVIPARLASIRLPGKVLKDIHGKPMIRHVYDAASGADLADDVFVATPDEEIIDVVSGFGGRAILTREHSTMLGRCSEAAEHLDSLNYKTVVVVGGDEPMIRPEMIDLALRNHQVMTCLVAKMQPDEDPSNPNTMKVLLGHDNSIIWFSRAAIPGKKPMQDCDVEYYKQVDVLVFNTQMLVRFNSMAQGPLERAEGIDMNRYMENGWGLMKGVLSPFDTRSVDTQEDLDAIIKAMEC